MKHITTFTIILMVLSLNLIAFSALIAGPAPNSGDCIPDGSGWEDRGHGINGAPNAGDGIPDGSGF